MEGFIKHMKNRMGKKTDLNLEILAFTFEHGEFKKCNPYTWLLNNFQLPKFI